MTKQRRKFPRVLGKTADGGPVCANGREGMTLLKLIEKGRTGLRAYDFPGGPPFRLGAYVFDLRSIGLAIRTEREEHATGWHAVYVLETPVIIIAVDHGDGRGKVSA
jgi:hypothetical protein